MALTNTEQNTTYKTDTASGSSPTMGYLPGIAKAVLQGQAQGVTFNPNAQYETNKSQYKDTEGYIAPPPATNVPLGKPMTTGKTESIPKDYKSFIGDNPDVFSTAPTPTTIVRNVPDWMGGGQKALDTVNPSSFIKSNRLDTFAQKEAERGSLAGGDWEIDHIVPLWAGGMDTSANKQLLSVADNYRKQQAHSIPIALLTAKKINKQQAELMAYEYQNLDKSIISQMPDLVNGKITLQDAEKYRQRFDSIIANPKPVNFGSVMAEVPQTISDFFGKDGFLTKTTDKLGIDSSLTEGARRYGQALVRGAGLGYLTSNKPVVDETVSNGWAGDIQNKVVLPALDFLGEQTGMIFSFGKAMEAVNAGRSALAGTKLFRFATPKVTGFVESTGWGKAAISAAAKVATAVEKGKKVNPTLTAIAKGLKIPITSNITETGVKAADILGAGFDFATVGQLTKQQNNDLKDRVFKFVTDATMGGFAPTNEQSLWGYSKLIGGITVLGTISNTVQGDEDAAAHAFQTGLMFAAFQSMNNPAFKKGVNIGGKNFALSDEKSLITELGGTDPVLNFFNKFKMKSPLSGYAPETRLTELVNNEANKVSTLFLKEAAPVTQAKFENTPKAKISDFKKEFITEARDGIRQKALEGASLAEQELMATQTLTALEQLESGGMGVAQLKQKVIDIANKPTTKAIGGQVPNKMIDMYGSDNNLYTTVTPRSDYVDTTTDNTIVGKIAGTASGATIENGEFANNIQHFEDALNSSSNKLIRNTVPEPDALWLVRTDENAIKSAIDLHNQTDLLVKAGLVDPWSPRESWGIFGKIRDQNGKDTFIQLGRVATKERIEGPRDLLPGEVLDAKTMEAYKLAKEYALNYSQNFKDSLYDRYDFNKNNHTLSQMMEGKGDFIKVGYIAQRWGMDTGNPGMPNLEHPFTTSVGQKHITISLTEQNIQDLIRHNQIYEEHNKIEIPKPDQTPEEIQKNKVVPKKVSTTPTTPVDVQTVLDTNPVARLKYTQALSLINKGDAISATKVLNDIVQQKNILPAEKNILIKDLKPKLDILVKSQNIPPTDPNQGPGTPILTPTTPPEAPQGPGMSNVPPIAKETQITGQNTPNTEVPQTNIPVVRPENKVDIFKQAKPIIKRVGLSNYQKIKEYNIKKVANIQKNLDNIAQKITNEGREATKEEKEGILKKLDKLGSDTMAKYKSINVKYGGDVNSISDKALKTNLKAMVLSAKSKIGDYTPGANESSRKQLEGVYQNIIRSELTGKPENMTDPDYKKLKDQYLTRMSTYVNETLGGKLGSEEFQPKEGADKITVDKDYIVNSINEEIKNGEITQKQAQSLINSIKDSKIMKGLVKRIVIPEGEKNSKVEDDSYPSSMIYGKKGVEQMTAYATEKYNSIQEGKKSANEYTKMKSKILDEGYKMIYGDDYKNNWSFNATQKPIESKQGAKGEENLLSRAFQQLNKQGHWKSQPVDVILEKLSGNEERIGGAMKKIEAQRKIEQEQKDLADTNQEKNIQEDILNKTADENIDNSSLTPEEINAGDLLRQPGTTVKSAGQDENMLTDLTAYEEMNPGVLKSEAIAMKIKSLEEIQKSEELGVREKYNIKQEIKKLQENGKENQNDAVFDAIRELVTASKNDNFIAKSVGREGNGFDQNVLKKKYLTEKMGEKPETESITDIGGDPFAGDKQTKEQTNYLDMRDIKKYMNKSKLGGKKFATPEYDKLPGKLDKPTMTYAGVGSRQTPPEIQKQMTELAKELERYGYTLNTGDAQAADAAFRNGATKKNVFTARRDATEQTRKIAREIHPNPTAAEPYIDLHARNTNQVFGKDLKTPVDFVIAWTKDGKATGGTGQAIRYAEGKKIPVINLYDKNWRDQLDKIISEPKEMKQRRIENIDATSPEGPTESKSMTLDKQELLESFGWESVPSKVKYMVSFKNENGQRLNLYTTTGTVTIQSDAEYDSGKTYKNVDTTEKLEKIVNENR